MKQVTTIFIMAIALIYIMGMQREQSHELEEAAKKNGALSYKLELATWVADNIESKAINWNYIDSALYANHKIDIR